MSRPPLSVHAMPAVRTVLFADVVLLLVVAGLLFAFMEHPAGVVAAAVRCLAAGGCAGAVRWVDRWFAAGR